MKVSVYLPYNKTLGRSGSNKGSVSFSKSCTAALHGGGDMVQWRVAPGSNPLPCCQAGESQSHLWLCFLIKLFRNSSSASMYVSGAELGLDGNFYFHLGCLEGFLEADCKDDLALYFTSISEVSDFVFSFSSPQGVHTSEKWVAPRVGD